MPDFLQTGSLLTLPLLGSDAGRLDADLTAWSRERPLALLLPCHARDLDSPALTTILTTVSGIPWISLVVIGLDGAGEAEHMAAAEKLRGINHECILLHHDMSRVAPGKGRNIRDTAAALFPRNDIFAVAMHDCDISTYSREFLARLCWPVLHPAASLLACKGYYARTAGGLHGRVFRLMFQPLLRAWVDVFPNQGWPAFLRAFRYPLSGELCITRELFRHQAFDSGWGFEVRLLHSLFRTAPHAVCQAELCTAYDHKHQAPASLAVMAGEIARTLRDTLREERTVPNARQWATLLASFEHAAARALRESALMAEMHRFPHDAAAERALTELFAAAVRRSFLPADNMVRAAGFEPATPSV